MKIVILDSYTLGSAGKQLDALEEIGTVIQYDRTAKDEILERAIGAEIVLTNKVPLTAETLQNLPELKYIGVLATGYNVIDIDQASKQGIVVSNIPSYSTESVAQLVFALILELVNGVGRHAESVRNGDWSQCVDFCYSLQSLTELDKKTIGIIGMGSIGQAVARIAGAFGMKVMAHTRTPKDLLGIEFTDLDQLLEKSDFVSLHCPLTESTNQMVNARFLDQMKTDAVLINTGRGGLVDEGALANALNEGVIAGAGLDVLSTEPPASDNPLLSAKNCVITPHIGWATDDAKRRLIELCIQNIKDFQTGSPSNQVN